MKRLTGKKIRLLLLGGRQEKERVLADVPSSYGNRCRRMAKARCCAADKANIAAMMLGVLEYEKN
ncbi:hypothetical protein MCI89_09105 [Muricomes sp. OA1]|uniref:Uncharacterized protein n=1 Tax=Hungatella hathewayi TaxID=154046 RepID=A0A3E2WNX5_9FIRM|nr:hypothetical protein [Faecalicatena contorta]MCH1972504.1 hypothetical protein [Muricomes sp. OA1]RGC28893.1 hypothetical protein DWX41_15610 [Hungatella hathewayi]